MTNLDQIRASRQTDVDSDFRKTLSRYPATQVNVKKLKFEKIRHWRHSIGLEKRAQLNTKLDEMWIKMLSLR